MRRHLGCTVVALVAVVLLPAIAAAQNSSATFSTADLAGRWFVSQVVTPTTSFVGDDIRAYNGRLVFDASGAIVPSADPADNTLADDLTEFDVSGSLTVSPEGLVAGTLTLTESFGSGETRLLVVREARLLVNKHTMVGAATIERDGGGTPATDTGLFTFVRLTGQVFTFAGDLDGDWHYHEITPTNQARSGNADWTRGTITFHAVGGCTEADLFFSDGSVRAQRSNGPTSFG